MNVDRRGIFCFFWVVFFTGCSPLPSGGNVGNLQSYPTPAIEAQWIRDGRPIEFEGSVWYPADGLEAMQDSEVYLVAEYKGVQVFVDRIDVRPYERLYTKFSKNRFRYFRQKDAP